MQSDSKYDEELKTTGNDDLTDLLNEAKHTILEMQHEIESLKSEIEQLRQQNRTLAAQNESSQNQTNDNKPAGDSGGMESKPAPTPTPTPVLVIQAQKDSPAAIPLEPVVIINDNGVERPTNTNRKAVENPNPKIVSKNVPQMPSDQTSQSDSTFVV